MRERAFYIKLLRAQLSEGELLVLFYNCLSEDHGGETFKKLLETQGFYAEFPKAKLIDPAHQNEYAPCVWEDLPNPKDV